MINFIPEIPQIIVAQEGSNGQIGILNVIKGQEALETIDHLIGRSKNVNK